ncbi:MAG: Abi family protein [Salinispira sp.]
MKYTKPHLTYTEQADVLISRGMTGNRSEIVSRLQFVNYYRLSGYFYPFRKTDDNGNKTDMFIDGTNFDTVWERYRFDRKLKLLVLDAIERVEISLRAHLSYQLSEQYEAFGYLDSRNFAHTNNPQADVNSLYQKISDDISRSKKFKEPFMIHYYTKYRGPHEYPPIWIAIEVMSFGTILSLFRSIKRSDQAAIAKKHTVPLPVFFSWIQSLNKVRNISAHQGRLWNRVLAVKPKIPHGKNYEELDPLIPIPDGRIFVILTILKYLMKTVASTSKWSDRLYSLLTEFPNIPLSQMGFPDNWATDELWK